MVAPLPRPPPRPPPLRRGAWLSLPVWVLGLQTAFRLVSGQGCSNTCPPINFGIVVPALCEGDLVGGGGTTPPTAGASTGGVSVDVEKTYRICHPPPSSSSPSSFSFGDFRGSTARGAVTVIANYYTGCNAGRRESGVFAHVAQEYYDRYGPDRVHFVQSVKGGGTCDQWSKIYQTDASELYPGAGVPLETPWSVDDDSYSLRDQFFTSPFGHPSYVVLDGDLRIRHKFIGPCCGYEQYGDCTPEIAKSLGDELSGYLDAILESGDAESDNDKESDKESDPSNEDESDDTTTNDNDDREPSGFDCEWSEWSPCSVRCGTTPGLRIRYRDRRCATSGTGGLLESEACTPGATDCNAVDGGLACVPEFGRIRTVREGVVTGLDSPRDVKFHPTPGYHFGDTGTGDEAWIVNGNNHSVSVVSNTDTAFQSTLSRRDRGYYHYMINGTALSFNKVAGSGRARDRDTLNYWAICNDDSNTYAGAKEANYFMGPTLYDSSPRNRNLVTKAGDACPAATFGSNNGGGEECYFLHSDMLHEAPSCRGIVHDPELETAYGTVYWAFDSTGNRKRGQLVRFDFQQPHGPGSMDHSIASVRRYVEVELESAGEGASQEGVHAGMIVHPTRRELFIAVPGKNQILRVGADSGRFARTAREEYPIFSNRLPSFEYSIWECVDRAVFADGIEQPSGMALSADGERLFVAERKTGRILCFEVATGALLDSIPTKARFRTIGGMDLAPTTGELYFVDDETNTLNAVRVLESCGASAYTSRRNPAYASVLESANTALGLGAGDDPFEHFETKEACTVDAVVPNATFFDQVHLDTGYASDDPDVQSAMAGMDAAAALLANRTDCGHDSDLNFDALLLGGYFCHACLPEQDQTCGGGGSCTNIQWQGYVCDNEFRIVASGDAESGGGEESGAIPGRYLLQRMDGSSVDASGLVLRPGITYTFSMMVPGEELCLSTLVSDRDDAFAIGAPTASEPTREDLKVGAVSRGRDEDGFRERASSVVTLGCATNGPLVFSTPGDRPLAGPQIYVVNVLGDPVFSMAMANTSDAAGGLSSSAVRPGTRACTGGLAALFLVLLGWCV